MSKESSAVDDIKKLARMMNGLVEFAGELENMASVKQACRESEAALENAKAQLAEVSAAHDNVLESHKTVQAEVKQLEDAKAKLSKEIADQSKVEKKKIIDSANAKADAIMNDAHDKALLVMKSVEDESAKLVALKSEVAAQQEALATVKSAIAKLKESLA